MILFNENFVMTDEIRINLICGSMRMYDIYPVNFHVTSFNPVTVISSNKQEIENYYKNKFSLDKLKIIDVDYKFVK